MFLFFIPKVCLIHTDTKFSALNVCVCVGVGGCGCVIHLLKHVDTYFLFTTAMWLNGFWAAASVHESI